MADYVDVALSLATVPRVFQQMLSNRETIIIHQMRVFQALTFIRWWAVVVLLYGRGVPQRRSFHVELEAERTTGIGVSAVAIHSTQCLENRASPERTT